MATVRGDPAYATHLSAGPTGWGADQPAGGKLGLVLEAGVTVGASDEVGDADAVAMADGAGVAEMAGVGLPFGAPLAVALQPAITAAIARVLIARVTRRGSRAAPVPFIPTSRPPDRPADAGLRGRSREWTRDRCRMVHQAGGHVQDAVGVSSLGVLQEWSVRM
ncbi:MAG: hypothetical protein ACXWQ6_10940 [Candidatus Limnocylindrales bacterium]